MEQLTAKKLKPIQAIRAKCLDCCCGNYQEVRLCTIGKCPLYPYRFGKRPKIDKSIDPNNNEEKTAASYGIFENAGV